MPDWTAVLPEHVRAAIDECDEVGEQDFLTAHPFGDARSYVLWADGTGYDSTAILGAAYQHATGEKLSSSQFRGGKADAAQTLRGLGFEVTAKVPDDGSSTPLDDETRALWAHEARDLLVGAAGRYQAVVTTSELAAYVQAESGVSTRKQPYSWIDDVLARVGTDCDERDEPNLAALCVNTQGSVGAGYGDLVEKLTGEAPADPDKHAADERLACHQHFGADLPAGGGFAALTSRLAASRERSRKIRIEEQPVALCPVHHIAVPPSGVCDYCD